MGSPSRNVQYHPPRLSEDRLNLPQPHSPSLPTHCSGKSGMRPSSLCIDNSVPSAVSSLRAFGSIRISGRPVRRTKLLPDLPDPRLGCLFRLETGNPPRGASRPSIAERSAPASHRQPPPAGSGGPTVPSCTLARGGDEEHSTDHRIAAGREQRLAAPPGMSTCPPIRSRSCHVPVRPAARAGIAGTAGAGAPNRHRPASRGAEPRHRDARLRRRGRRRGRARPERGPARGRRAVPRR